MDFKVLKEAVGKKFDEMVEQGNLFVSTATKDQLWETYLGSFPEGSNPIFRERTEHDCNCCKSYIRKVGNVLSIDEQGNLSSIWDINVGGDYQVVANAMSELVKGQGVRSMFYSNERVIGTDHNKDNFNPEITWNHFYQVLPSSVVCSTASSLIGDSINNFNVLKRSVNEITDEAIETVLDLINSNAIYRGSEFKRQVGILKTVKSKILGFHGECRDNMIWRISAKLGASSSFRNSVIGTLLVDLSDGVDLESAVRSYESKVAPQNYKRPTKVVTKSMVENAEKVVEELNIGDALSRRFAKTEDVTVNNVLFVDRSVKKKMGIFDAIKQETPNVIPNTPVGVPVSIEEFINDIVPKSESISVAMDNTHINNLMSLISPVDSSAESILKWNNNFTWSYKGEVTDSIRERVKKAGGNVEGFLRASLSWFNGDDLDIHMETPRGTINFHTKNRGGGQLDVDMNAGGVDNSKDPVENIFWKDKSRVTPGLYTVKVHNYDKRSNTDVGFEVEVEFGGKLFNFVYDQAVQNRRYINVCQFEVTEDYEIKMKPLIEEKSRSKEVWGIKTQQFRRVNMIMNSPNHWDGQEKGNKHWFFILDGCVNPEQPRGFYNEFLRDELQSHRKVFEVLGSKMKPEWSEEQLSGLGFSSTMKNEVMVQAVGEDFNTIYKVQF